MKIIKVTETVDNINQTGSGNVNDVSWTLRTKDNSIIPAGSLVKVLEISGVKLIVEPYMEDTQNQKLTEPKRLEVLKQKLNAETDEKKVRYFDGYIDGMVETLTLFSCLEQGRFQNKWEETLEKLHREQEEK